MRQPVPNILLQQGIGILDQLGCVDYLSFGSEWAEVEDFSAYATLFLEEPEKYKQILQEQLKSGKSFPEARAFAAGNLLFDSKPEKAIEFLKEPNHILGLEYIKALQRRNSFIRPVVIKRKGNHYHENKLTENYSSATAIRQEMYHFYRNFSRKIRIIQKLVIAENVEIREKIPITESAISIIILITKKKKHPGHLKKHFVENIFLL